ncbi:MAG: hypothetical protein ACI4QV_01300 [Acutalibacteraceae bacterium]
MSEKGIVSANEQAYAEMNRTAPKGGTVLFGSNNFARFQAEEFIHRGFSEEIICNRSSENLKITDALNFYRVCISELRPKKVFICLGDCDIISGDADIADFIEKYEWLLYEIHSDGVRKIYVLPVFNDSPFCEKLNLCLKKTADNYGCRYIDCLSPLSPDLFFSIRCYLRSGRITFADAMGTY